MSLPGGVVDERDGLGRVSSSCDGPPCASDRTSHRMLSPAKFQRGSTVAMSPALESSRGHHVFTGPDSGHGLGERHPGRDRFARLLAAGLRGGQRDVLSRRPGDAVDDEGVCAFALGRSGALPLPSVAGVAYEHKSGRLAGGAPRQPRPRVAARLGHEEGREVGSGWLVTAHPVGAFRLTQLGAGLCVREGIEPTPALERAKVASGKGARWVELLVVAGDCDGLTVQLARLQQLDSMGNADHRQAGDFGWEAPVGRLAGRQR